jgi:cytochrome c oxidase subunit 1
MSGYRFDERLGRLHFVLAVVGANLAFLPMFWLGYLGMPRRVSTYPANAGFDTLNLVSSVGGFIFGASFLVLLYNVFRTFRLRVPAGDDPWQGTTLEWASASPPPRFNFDAEHPLPPITSYAPLLDARQRETEPVPA